LFATLAGRFISITTKGFKVIVNNDLDRVGASQWTVNRKIGTNAPIRSGQVSVAESMEFTEKEEGIANILRRLRRAERSRW
jgi:hypothetical protein